MASRAPGIKGLFKRSAYGPDSDIVEIEAIPIAGLQRLDAELALGDLEDQGIALGKRIGFCAAWHGFAPDGLGARGLR